jgi:hypothetical protein
MVLPEFEIIQELTLKRVLLTEFHPGSRFFNMLSVFVMLLSY